MSVTDSKFAHVNGRLLAGTRAQVSVFDRGFLYGDGLFETLRAYEGKLFALAEHLARLRSSASFLGIRVPRRPWEKDVSALLQRNQLVGTDAWVRITLTRGVAAPAVVPPSRIRPTVVITAGRLDPRIARAQQRGVRATLLPFARHGFLAEHKALNYLPGVLGKSFAARRGAFEGLFVDTDGWVTEGTTSNLFIWRNTRLLTPPAASILSGITRRLVIQAAVADGVGVEERPLTTRDLFDADEAFITSSLAEVVPLIAVDAHRIGNGKVGTHTRRMQRWYRQTVDQALGRA
jgi:branched-chain amino acid aminotransferase